MKSMYRVISVVLLIGFASIALFLAGCVTAKQKMLDAGLRPVNDTDFQSLFSKKIDAEFIDAKSQSSFPISYFPDGKVQTKSSNFNDDGTYWFKNGEQCSKWEKIRNGKEACYIWFKIAERKYDIYASDGSKDGSLTIK